MQLLKIKKPLLHSVEIPGMITASYGGGAEKYEEGRIGTKKDTVERYGKRRNDTNATLPF